MHLLAMTVADADAGRAQLAREGFQPDEPVRLTRAIPLPDGGEAEGRFSVVRVPADKMPEGRIQVLAHHTPEIVWQERWMAHENRIVSLEAALLVVADPLEAATRYGRFLGREPVRLDPQRVLLRLDRGALVFVAEAMPFGFPQAPAMPWIAAYALGSADREASLAHFEAGGATSLGVHSGEDLLALPAALGGHVSLGVPDCLPFWAR